MSEVVNFSVKAISEYAGYFRLAFKKMNAEYSEEYIDDDHGVIRFRVSCSRDSAAILQEEVPLFAYASIGIS
jgi:hypothetical protein